MWQKCFDTADCPNYRSPPFPVTAEAWRSDIHQELPTEALTLWNSLNGGIEDLQLTQPSFLAATVQAMEASSSAAPNTGKGIMLSGSGDPDDDQSYLAAVLALEASESGKIVAATCTTSSSSSSSSSTAADVGSGNSHFDIGAQLLGSSDPELDAILASVDLESLVSAASAAKPTS